MDCNYYSNIEFTHKETALNLMCLALCFKMPWNKIVDVKPLIVTIILFQ